MNMNAIQVNSSLCPESCVRGKTHIQKQCPVAFSLCSSRIRVSRKVAIKGLKRHCFLPVCLSRGDVSSGSGDQDPLWKLFGKAMENFGEKSSIEGLLKQQIEKQEYYEGGGPGGKPPGRGGGGGGEFDDFEDEGFAGVLDETIQVVLATLGFIFAYVYIISGAEIAKLAKDYVKYLFGGKKSIRLERFFYQWERFFKHLKSLGQEEEVDPFWLEKAIVRTPTWWDDPDKYRQVLISELQTRSDDE